MRILRSFSDEKGRISVWLVVVIVKTQIFVIIQAERQTITLVATGHLAMIIKHVNMMNVIIIVNICQSRAIKLISYVRNVKIGNINGYGLVISFVHIAAEH